MSISLVILCLNEELGLKPTYDNYKNQFLKLEIDHEIIIVNDGSSDQTPKIAQNIKNQDKCVSIITNPHPKGMGYGYKKGLEVASKDFYMFAGGYSALNGEDIQRLTKAIQNSDMVMAVITNQQVRQPLRRFLSKTFTILMNSITGLDLKYYNAMVLIRRTLLQNINIRSNGYTFSAESVTKLIKQVNCNYCEIPVRLSLNKKKVSEKKFKFFSNLLQALSFFIFLFYDIYLKKYFKK